MARVYIVDQLVMIWNEIIPLCIGTKEIKTGNPVLFVTWKAFNFYAENAMEWLLYRELAFSGKFKRKVFERRQILSSFFVDSAV